MHKKNWIFFIIKLSVLKQILLNGFRKEASFKFVKDHLF